MDILVAIFCTSLFTENCTFVISGYRGISEEEIDSVLSNPEMIFKQDDEVMVYQSLSIDKQFVFRIFVNISKLPNLVITA
jgi:hypothetical protein